MKGRMQKERGRSGGNVIRRTSECVLQIQTELKKNIEKKELVTIISNFYRTGMRKRGQFYTKIFLYGRIM